MANPEVKHAPIRQSVHVDCPIEETFRLFTEGFGDWWPLAPSSPRRDAAETCLMEPGVGGRILERTTSGKERDWGSVIEWDPPEHVSFTWAPDGIDEGRSIVDVQFSIEADGTRVTLIHTGWQAAGVAVSAVHTGYPAVWRKLLESCFAEFVGEQMLVTV
jgi:uncharacterized protein YndB with AHSA1/START domain